MKLLGETNCLVFSELTQQESESYSEKFGEHYWMDVENIVCYPVKEMNRWVKGKYETFFGCSLDKAEFLIVYLYDSSRAN